MVKTVLHELVKLRGAAIKGHLSMVPIDMKPQPIILAYIDLNLEVIIIILYLLFFFIILKNKLLITNEKLQLIVNSYLYLFVISFFFLVHYIYYWSRDTDLSFIPVFNNWPDSSGSKDVDINWVWGPNSLG